jgi:hypothetical protein
MQITTEQANKQISDWEEQQARKADAVRIVISHPELLAIVAKVLAAESATQKLPTTARQASTSTRKGNLRDAVAKAVATMAGRFTVLGIVDAMRLSGFQFSVRSPTIAANAVLRKMLAKGTIRIAQAGTGRAPHQYERTEQNRRDLKVA